jgi:hypothetical protein
VDAVKTVLEKTEAPERLEELKTTARQRQERSDMLWFELILSMATLQGSSGSTRATDGEYYSQVEYETLRGMDDSERIDHLEGVLLDAGVNMHLRKADFIDAQLKRIESLGGLDAAQQAFESKEGKEARWTSCENSKVLVTSTPAISEWTSSIPTFRIQLLLTPE